MKKVIKYITLLFIVLIPSIIILDDWIIKKVILHQIESKTKKRAYLESISIQYLPSLKVEIKGLMIPNPKQDNFIISSKQISIKINLFQLFNKSLIIDELISSNTIVFDTSKKTIPLMIDKDNQQVSDIIEEKNDSPIKNKINEIISQISINDYINADIKLTSYDEELSEIDTVIENSNKVINDKKEIILTDTNSILYKINSLKIDNIDSINKYNELNKSLKKINKDTKKIEKEISSLDEIYIQSIDRIDDIETKIIKKINDSINIKVSEANNNIVSTFSEPIESLIKNIFKRKKSPTKNIKVENFKGITYTFNQIQYPKFLIKKLEINKPDNNVYFTGRNLTLSEIVKQPLTFSGRIKNQQQFRRFEIDLNSNDKVNYYISQETKNIILNKEKIYGDEQIRVDILENNTTYVQINGVLSNKSDIEINLLIENPLYRVINKTPTPDIKQAFFESLNEEDIQVTINIQGSLENLEISTITNIDNLISDISNKVINEKLDSVKQSQKDKLAKVKKENKNAIDKKINSFDNNYNESVKKMNFQLNEIISQKDEIEKTISEKKKELENSVKDKFSEKASDLFD